MKALYKQSLFRGKAYLWLASVGAIAGLALFLGNARADGPVTMAPPIQPGYDRVYTTPDDYQSNSSEDSVFNWHEVPQDQQVPITRAVFDQGGYQLFDSVGETIVVPFKDSNLYVMKFAHSPNGTMFFVNQGDAPVLYVPDNGFLENATVAGARWYPFSEDFHPEHPVFLGIAPSWAAFVDMGWYPGMYAFGGYWCGESFFNGGIFVPTVNLVFIIGDHRFHRFDDFHDYCFRHGGFHRIGFFDRDIYRWVGHPRDVFPPFQGGHPWHPDEDRGNRGGDRDFGSGARDRNIPFRGADRGELDRSGERQFQGGRTWNDQGDERSTRGDRFTGDDHPAHVFRGASGDSGNRSFGDGNAQVYRSDSGDGRAQYGAGSGRIFRGDQGSDNSGRGFGRDSETQGSTGGSHRGYVSNGGNSEMAPARTYGGNSEAAPAHVYGDSSGSGREYSSGGDRSSGSGDRSYGGSYSGGGSSGGWSGGGGGHWGR